MHLLSFLPRTMMEGWQLSYPAPSPLSCRRVWGQGRNTQWTWWLWETRDAASRSLLLSPHVRTPTIMTNDLIHQQNNGSQSVIWGPPGVIDDLSWLSPVKVFDIASKLVSWLHTNTISICAFTALWKMLWIKQPSPTQWSTLGALLLYCHLLPHTWHIIYRLIE